MKTITLVLSFVLLLPCCFGTAQDQSKVDWDRKYKQLLESDPDIREKIESGNATKNDVIQWLQQKQPNQSTGGNKKPSAKTGTSKGLSDFQLKLNELVQSGKLSKEDAAKLEATMNPQKKVQEKLKKQDKVDWDAAYDKLLQRRPEIRKKVDNGGATKEQIIQSLKLRANAKNSKGRAKDAKNSRMRTKSGSREGSTNFYAILIGRLKSKDIELGEMEIDVDYVISDRPKLNSDLIGTRVKLVGVSGQFLDALLQIKRGETIKVRAGDFNPETKVVGFGYKFQVLERTAPFKPGTFGVPPQEFRGFSGELSGKIVEAAGYEVLLEVQQSKPSKSSTAKTAQSILGKRIRIAGFYDQHREAFADLHEGDKIQLSVTHRNPESDALNVTDVLKQVN
ncbi:MAG: hypothetical protein P8J27_06245 [Mariniblastus sp.]|nr:hypothetical protein [Mariniblastus sp.]